MSSVRPPFDPEIVKALLPAMVDGTLSASLSTDRAVRLADLRKGAAIFFGAGDETVNSDPSLESERVTIPGPRGDIDILIIRPKGASSTDKRPAIYAMHSGGTVCGDEYTNISVHVDWMKGIDGIVASVNYRLSPEHPGLAPYEDCWEGLVWFAKQSERFGFDPEKLFVGGVSAGGGLATAAAIMARDKGFPKLCGQILVCPMLDDRATTVSNKQYFYHGPFTGDADEFNWSCLLGDRRATDNVSIFEAPGRATDLSNLPPAYLEVGSAEPLRDSTVAFASRLWEHGVQAELMVFAGGVHAFDLFAPEATVSKEAAEARVRWLRRRLAELE